MKKSELWAIYIKKYPQFAGEGNVTLSAKGLQKLFNQTWDYAYYEGEPEEEITFPQNSVNPIAELEKIFGFK
jgi:hypothetical protein